MELCLNVDYHPKAPPKTTKKKANFKQAAAIYSPVLNQSPSGETDNFLQPTNIIIQTRVKSSNNDSVRSDPSIL